MAYSPIFGWGGTQVSNITSGTAPRTSDAVDRAKAELYGMARTAANTPNAQDQALLAMLNERAGAQGGPFNDATKQALMTQAADSAGYAALQSKARIQGSAGDPSVMAANNEADARRMAQIQQAQLGINTQANVANYDARGQALGQLGAYNQMAQNRQTDNQRYLMGLLQQETQYRPDAGSAGGIPSFADSRPRDSLAAWEARQPTGGMGTYQPGRMITGAQAPVQAAAAPAVVPATLSQQQREAYSQQDAQDRAMDYRVQDLRKGTGGYTPTKTIAPTTRLY